MKDLQHIEQTYGGGVATLIKTLFTGFAVLAVAWISLVVIPNSVPSNEVSGDTQPGINLRSGILPTNDSTTSFGSLRFGIEFKESNDDDEVYEMDYDNETKSFVLEDKEFTSLYVKSVLHPSKKGKVRAAIRNETCFALYYGPKDAENEDDMELVDNQKEGCLRFQKDEIIRLDGERTLVLSEICAQVKVNDEGVPELVGGCGENGGYASKYLPDQKGAKHSLKFVIQNAEVPKPTVRATESETISPVSNEGLLSGVRWFVGTLAVVFLLVLGGIIGFMKYKERGQIVLVPTHVKMQMEISDNSCETAAINQFDDRVPTFAN